MKEHDLDLRPERVIVDFEMLMIKALRRTFRGIHVQLYTLVIFIFAKTFIGNFFSFITISIKKY